MSNSGGCAGDTLSRLCHLIDDSLPRFTDSDLVSLTLTQEQERQLLISLSKILKQIRSWTTELDIGTQSGVDGVGSGDSHPAEHECLNRIVLNLVFLLNDKSQFVQHLVGSIFVGISEFLAAYGSDWGDFIELLCKCFEFALCNSFAHSKQPSIGGAQSFKSTMWHTSFVKSRLNNSTWNCMAGTMGILRGITKHLKGECDEELVSILLNSFSDNLLKVPWGLLDGINDDNTKVRGTFPREHTLLLTNTAETEAKILFLGYLVQLLCSLLELTGSVKDGSISHIKYAILDNVCDLVPRLLHWCLGGEWSCRHRHIRPYFQHKIVMLMIRLSDHIQPDVLIFIRWLQLLQEYYKNLFAIPMSQLEFNQDGTLEDSPFLLSLSVQEVHHVSLHHLQRQAVYFFIRCSLTLIDTRLRNPAADLNCNCMGENSFPSGSNAINDCCAGKEGLLQLYEWLQVQVPTNMFTKDEMYQENCIKFASSFIRLYKNEDDLLFEVLLQLFTISLWSEIVSLKGKTACQDADNNILFHISHLFSPLLLFHVFLAELQYDHQLLLDYLISKDTGSKCAEYLLRSLRTVCDSWKLFVEFPVRDQAWPHSCKRKRAFHEDSNSADPLQSGSALLSDQAEEGHDLGRRFFIRTPQVEDAKQCLLSLMNALKKLHKRKLFPYNPEVLIRRMINFATYIWSGSKRNARTKVSGTLVSGYHR